METPKIILMADNMKSFLDERREFLEQAGFTVIAAYNRADAENILARGGVDLAILDIRMECDEDDADTSGLELARKFGPELPIIMLTGFPTWENVKASLGRDIQGLGPAVDFLAKPEGAELMVRAVKLTLENPRLKQNMLHDFQAESLQAMYDAFSKKSPVETADTFQKSLERTEKDMLQYRKMLALQSQSAQRIALWAGLVGIGVILLGAVLVYLKALPLAALSGVAGLISEAVSVMFISRAAQASRLVEKSYNQLQEIYKASQLISICDTIEMKNKREDSKIMILRRLAEKWFKQQGGPS